MKSDKFLLHCVLTVRKCPSTGNYSIHGLWFDENRNQKQIKHCNLKRTNPNKIPKSLRRNMDNYWSDCNQTMKNETFWKYQYCKHGYIFDEVEYYSLTLDAFWFFVVDVELFDEVKNVPENHEIRINLLYNIHTRKWMRNTQPKIYNYASKIEKLYNEIKSKIERQSTLKERKNYKILLEKLKSTYDEWEKFDSETYKNRSSTISNQNAPRS